MDNNVMCCRWGVLLQTLGVKRRGWAPCCAAPAAVIALGLVLVLPAGAESLTMLTPQDFERLWLDNNRQNVARRFLEFGNTVARGGVNNLMEFYEDQGPHVLLPTDQGVVEGSISHDLLTLYNDTALLRLDLTSVAARGSTAGGYGSWNYGDYLLAYVHRATTYDGYAIFGLRQRYSPQLTQVNQQLVFQNANPDDAVHNGPFLQIGWNGQSFGMYTLELDQLDFLFYQHAWQVTPTAILSWGLNYAARVDAANGRAYVGSYLSLRAPTAAESGSGIEVGYRRYEDGVQQMDHANITVGGPVLKNLGFEVSGGFHSAGTGRVTGYKADLFLGSKQNRFGFVVQRNSTDAMSLAIPNESVLTVYFVRTNLLL
jgi:hypothetical protein